MALPNSSIGTLKSLKRCIYILTKTQHKIAFFCFILHLSSLCGAQVGINKLAYLHCVYCKVKTRIQGEECHNPRSNVQVCENMWTRMLLYLIRSLSILFETWLVFFSFPFFSKQWTFMCSIFLNSLCVSSTKIYLERYSKTLKHGASIWWKWMACFCVLLVQKQHVYKWVYVILILGL